VSGALANAEPQRSIASFRWFPAHFFGSNATFASQRPSVCSDVGAAPTRAFMLR